MKRPHAFSTEFRERAVTLVLVEKLPQAEVARLLKIGTATLTHWLRRYREEGHLKPRSTRGKPPRKWSEEHLLLLRKLVEEKPDRTIKELRALLMVQGNVTLSTGTLFTMLEIAAFTFKKNTEGR